ncbi:MAG: RuBisCO large subunit C-terminal-like domain-containing protein [Acidobacteriota bacterium]
MSGERLRAVYHLRGNAAEAGEIAREICVEQTVEFPVELIHREDVREGIIGRLVDLRPLGEDLHRAEVDYPIEVAGRELTQLLNVLMGNISLKRGIRLVGFDLPPGLAALYKGPRFGRQGVRGLVGRPAGPLLCTAVKPMGLSPHELAILAGQFAAGGIDAVKDDHGLCDQSFCRFEERVRRCAAAVNEANAKHGGRCIYLPNVTAPCDELIERVHKAVEWGAGGFVLSPGLSGFDFMRRIAEDDSIALPIFSHPAWQGWAIVSGDSGISHGTIFGRIARLAGADATIFPSFRGRFSFSREECLDIVQCTECDLGGLNPIFPVPAGGMSLPRVPELISFYGPDVVLLIGGDLHRHGPDLAASCRRLVDLARNARPPEIPRPAG